MRKFLPAAHASIEEGVSETRAAELARIGTQATAALSRGHGLVPGQVVATRQTYARAASNQAGATAEAGPQSTVHDPFPHITQKLPDLAALLRRQAAHREVTDPSVAGVLASYQPQPIAASDSTDVQLLRVQSTFWLTTQLLSRLFVAGSQLSSRITSLPASAWQLRPATLRARLMRTIVQSLAVRRTGLRAFACGACGQVWSAAIYLPDGSVTTRCTNAAQRAIHLEESISCAAAAMWIPEFGKLAAVPLADAAVLDVVLTQCDRLREILVKKRESSDASKTAQELARTALQRSVHEAQVGLVKVVNDIVESKAWMCLSRTGSAATLVNLAVSPADLEDDSAALLSRLREASQGLAAALRAHHVRDSLEESAKLLHRLDLYLAQKDSLVARGGGGLRNAAVAESGATGSLTEADAAAISRVLEEDRDSDEDRVGGQGVTGIDDDWTQVEDLGRRRGKKKRVKAAGPQGGRAAHLK